MIEYTPVLPVQKLHLILINQTQAGCSLFSRTYHGIDSLGPFPIEARLSALTALLCWDLVFKDGADSAREFFCEVCTSETGGTLNENIGDLPDEFLREAKQTLQTLEELWPYDAKIARKIIQNLDDVRAALSPVIQSEIPGVFVPAKSKGFCRFGSSPEVLPGGTPFDLLLHIYQLRASESVRQNPVFFANLVHSDIPVKEVEFPIP